MPLKTRAELEAKYAAKIPREKLFWGDGAVDPKVYADMGYKYVEDTKRKKAVNDRGDVLFVKP